MKVRDIAVYSGSFNPLHIGHLAIIRHLIDEAGFDMVYLVVSPKNPLKDGISSESGRERFEAAVEAVERRFVHSGMKDTDAAGEARVKVDDIELNMPEPHYTVRTLDALQEREPDNRFTLIMGADNLADLRRWRDYGRILSVYGIAVFPRKGIDMPKVREELMKEDPSYRIRLLDAHTTDISSSEIRQAASEGRDISRWLM